MRKRLRVTVIALVAILLLGLGALLGRTLWQQRNRDMKPTGLEFLPGISQHIQDFHRVKVQDGRKVWEVEAKDAQYREDDGTVLVRGALLQLYLKDGRTFGLKGDEGRIVLDGREITRVDLDGDIEVTFGNYVMRTAHASYDHQRQLISTPGAVDITGRALRVRGERMEVQVESQRLRLLRNVSMELQPALFKDGGSNDPPL
jgi:LPS export ABC transporter protein LptC